MASGKARRRRHCDEYGCWTRRGSVRGVSLLAALLEFSKRNKCDDGYDAASVWILEVAVGKPECTDRSEVRALNHPERSARDTLATAPVPPFHFDSLLNLCHAIVS